MDQTAARQHDIALGDQLRILDRDATVVGLSDETTFWAGSIAFVRVSMLQSLLLSPTLESFLLVTPAPGISAESLRETIDVPGTEALLKSHVVANDRALMARVYDAPIGLMVVIAFVVGVLVVGLVIYTATIERRREYGALKAIGARNRTLYQVVTTQAAIAAMCGAIAGVGLAYGAAAALMTWRAQFLVAIEVPMIAIVLASSLLMALLAALLPARSVATLEPAEVFRA